VFPLGEVTAVASPHYSMTNHGVDLTKQALDEDPINDWRFGSDETLKAKENDIAPEVNGFVGAVFAWNGIKNGIYYKVSDTINHCVDFIKKGFESYLPVGELQNKGGEKMDCVTRGHHNKIEEKLNYAKLSKSTLKFFTDNGYIKDGKFALNDRICAILSGTTSNGNSLKAPIDTIRKIGIFPKDIIPQLDMSFRKYYDRSDITQEMLDLGKKSLEYISINYATIDSGEMKKLSGDTKWLIFDNYLDNGIDGDYIKQLAENYIIYPTAYEIIINDLKKNEGENMLIEIELVKKLNSPDYLFRDKKDQSLWHRIGNEKVFKAIAGDFPAEIDELEIAEENIAEPIYLSSSFMDMVVNFFSKLKGNGR